MAPAKRGVVAAFDAESGLGSVRSDEGRTYGFHCTQIAGGSRLIDQDTRVEFDVVAGQVGRWEAAAVRPCAG